MGLRVFEPGWLQGEFRNLKILSHYGGGQGEGEVAWGSGDSTLVAGWGGQPSGMG